VASSSAAKALIETNNKPNPIILVIKILQPPEVAYPLQKGASLYQSVKPSIIFVSIA